MSKAISPLNDYIRTFDKYKEVMEINPQEYIDELGDEDEWTVESVKEEILK